LSEQRYRILHTIASADPAGGGTIQAVRSISDEMKRMGHSVELATLDAPGSGYLEGFPGAVHALGPGSGNYGYSSRFQQWMKEHREDYDAVIVHGIWQFIGFAVRRALLGSGTPYFVFTHGMLDPWFKRQYPLKHLKKWLYWPFAEYRVLRDARAVLFTAEEERLLARQSFWLYRCTERVVRYGVAPVPYQKAEAQAAFFEKFAQLKDKRLWIFLGRMHPKKCGDYLLRAFAELKDADPHLHVVMAGPDDSECAKDWKKLAQDLGLGARVTWTRMLSGALKWGALYSSELFVLPSHQENFGIAVVEALACGVPVVISNRVNIWREIVSANAGLATDDTLEATTRALKQFLAMPPQERASMAANAERCFREQFQISKTAERLCEVFREFGIGGRVSSAPVLH